MSDAVARLIEYNTQDLVKMIVEARQCSVTEAMEALYPSATFSGLADPETGLYLESPSYLYELFERVG